MQLIEEDIEELKSHLETDRFLEEDFQKRGDLTKNQREDDGFNF